MNHVDFERLRLTHKTVRSELLAERMPDGRWIGRVASSPVATAAAISALVVARRRVELSCCGMPAPVSRPGRTSLPASDDGYSPDVIVEGPLSELVVGGLHWLASVQNDDGGWGDCDGAKSNLAATAMVLAAFHLTGVPANYADLMARADAYVAAQGGLAKLREPVNGDPTWAAPALVSCAIADRIDWRKVPAVAFEVCCKLPRDQWLAAPSLDETGKSLAVEMACGLARFHHAPTRNPWRRFQRRNCLETSLLVLERWQGADGSYLGSPLSTAMVVMSLAGSGFREHAAVQMGVEYLLSTVRADATWSVVADLSVRNTAQAITSLAAANGGGPEFHETVAEEHDEIFTDECLDWLLSCQHDHHRRPTGVAPGGWSWSDSAGAVATVSDTAIVLTALAKWPGSISSQSALRLDHAARVGVAWLLDHQHAQGGWTVCAGEGVGRGRHTLSCAADVTAGAVSALAAWRKIWKRSRSSTDNPQLAAERQQLRERIKQAVSRAMNWIATEQRPDGSFVAAEYGNEVQTDRKNPVYGTSRVLAAAASLGQSHTQLVQRAVEWLSKAQHISGGWGPPRTPLNYFGTSRPGSGSWRINEGLAGECSAEETAWAVAALLPLAVPGTPAGEAVSRGLKWLAEAVEKDLLIRPAVVGVWQGKFWYYERLTPLIAAVEAVSPAASELARPAEIAHSHR